jgi:hypothetical protein
MKKSVTSFLIFAWLVFASGPEIIRADDSSEPNYRTFDAVALQALALFLEAPAWATQLHYEPSKGFAELVRSHPQALLWVGGRWFFSAADASDPTRPVALDSSKYPLEPNDLTVALQILSQEYMVNYISCMRAAFAGNGKTECYKLLIQMASKVGQNIKEPDLTQFLTADLGARLIALSSNNSEWKHLLESRDDPNVNSAVAANNQLEAGKVLAAWLGKGVKVPGGTTVVFSPVKASSLGTDWYDFGGNPSSQAQPISAKGKLRVFGWRVANGDVSLTSLDNKPDVYSIVFDNSRSLIVKGSVTEDDITSVFKETSWDEVTTMAKEKNWITYFSRNGSGILGKLEPTIQ